MSHTPRPDSSENEALVIAKWGLEGLDEIYLMLPELKKRAPELSDAQIDAIAERVASQVTQRFNDEKHCEMKSSIKKAVRDIALGVIASGIWELIVYLSTHVLHFDGEMQRESTAEERNLKQVAVKLTKGIDREQVKDLENARFYLDELGGRFVKHYVNEIAQSGFLKELVAARVTRLRLAPEWIEKIEKTTSQDIFEDLYHELQRASMQNILAG